MISRRPEDLSLSLWQGDALFRCVVIRVMPTPARDFGVPSANRGQIESVLMWGAKGNFSASVKRESVCPKSTTLQLTLQC